jgi:hypothetical protein
MFSLKQRNKLLRTLRISYVLLGNASFILQSAIQTGNVIVLFLSGKGLSKRMHVLHIGPNARFAIFVFLLQVTLVVLNSVDVPQCEVWGAVLPLTSSNSHNF